jgi:hypothetical protein
VSDPEPAGTPPVPRARLSPALQTVRRSLTRAAAFVRRRALRLALIAGALAALVAGGVALRASREARTWQAWFAAEQVPELRLWLDEAARAALKRRPRELVRAELEYEGERRVVGVRLKGHRSMKPLDEKAAFKIAIDHFDRTQRFLGVRRLTLNNMVEDPTLLREFLGYRVFRELGVEAPRVGYASVFVDGEPRGLYSIVEDIDELVARSAPEAGGVVYEGEYGCDLFPEDVAGFDKDHGKDPGRAALAAFAEAAGGDARRLFGAEEGPLDQRAFLAFLAASTIVGDFDGYRHSHNYRIHLDPESQRWQFVPWGLDRAFQRPLSIFDSQGWLAKRCFADPACRLDYVRSLHGAVERFEALRLTQTLNTLAPRLDPLDSVASAALAKGQPSAAERAAARRKLAGFIRRRPEQIRKQLGCIDASGRELDADGDGHGCMDCNDADASVGPHAAEVCDGVDNDCSGLVDDAAACDCERREISGRTFHFCNWPMPWPEAEALCERKGLVLARVDSKRLSQALYREANEIARSAWWIGYSDREEEGRFSWREGDAGSFGFWDRRQPNNRSCNEDCVALRDGKKGRWHDSPCNQHRPFICAVPFPPETLGAAADAPRSAD